MIKIVFQGDSVTDAVRNRNSDENEGMGYVTLVKGILGSENPGKYKFMNRGVIGDRMCDMYARVRRDTINLAPDYISFLIGVNEVLHEYIRKDGFSVKRFKELYIMMLEDVYEALPNVKIFIMEPFITPGSATVSTEENPGRWEFYRDNLPAYQNASKEVAEHFGIPFVPLQKMMSEADRQAGEGILLIDGIHPTTDGAGLIAREWIRTFKSIE